MEDPQWCLPRLQGTMEEERERETERERERERERSVECATVKYAVLGDIRSTVT